MQSCSYLSLLPLGHCSGWLLQIYCVVRLFNIFLLAIREMISKDVQKKISNIQVILEDINYLLEALVLEGEVRLLLQSLLRQKATGIYYLFI